MVLLSFPCSIPSEAVRGCPNSRQLDNAVVIRSSIMGTHLRSGPKSAENTCFRHGGPITPPRRVQGKAYALSESGVGTLTLNANKISLNEYMITLEKPLGIRFALSINGTLYVHALRKGGNAENSRMIMVGDVLKKISNLSGHGMMDVEDFVLTMEVIKEKSGPVNLVLERPVFPFPIQQFPLTKYPEATYNRGRVPIVTWDKNILASGLQTRSGEHGNTGFSLFSSKFLKPKGWKALSSFINNGAVGSQVHMNSSSRVMPVQPSDEIVALFTEKESMEGVEWSYGNFPVDQYMNALSRAEGELCYNHSLGMRYTKVTEHIYVGSCVQTEADVHALSNNTGITAVLNLQCESERENWGIDSQAINTAFHQNNFVVVNCPIREVDSVDLRRKLPFSVGVLYRLLRRNHRVFVTCTTGLDRSPACVIAYLHWIQDVVLQEALNFVTSLHPCVPDRPALVWATWDVIAMAVEGNHKGPPTHAAQFIWNHGCREGEEVQLVGDFKGNWNEPIKAVHVTGPKYAIDLRLPQGKYNYKFIVGGQWRHSTILPTETDQWGNVNNVIWIGDVASVKFESPAQQKVKDPTTVKVIERPLTEDERFTLAFAARRIAFSICPIRLAPKK